MVISAARTPVFRGNYQLNMDAKGRLAVPKRYRDCLEAKHGLKMVITTDEFEPCLLVYPLPVWDDFEKRLRRHPDLQPEADDKARALANWMYRGFVGDAADCEIDSHGRLLIPPRLRKEAALKKQVRLVGQTEKFELWDESTWSERSAGAFARNKNRVREAPSHRASPAALS